MAFLKKFWSFLTNSNNTRRDRLVTHLGETEYNQEKLELIKKIRALEGQLSKIQANSRKKVFSDKNEVDEIDLIKELKQKSDKIVAKKHEGLYSLNTLFLKILKNPKSKIEIVDKDDSVVFDYFKDFVVLKTGNIGIRGKSGQVWAEGRTLNNIIWKPETIQNQIKRKRIQLAVDKDFNFVPDLEKLMMPEIKYDESDDLFHESEEVMRPFKEMLIERDKKINGLLDDKSTLEKMNELMSHKIKKIEQSLSVLNQRAEISDSELSKTIQTSLDSLKVIGGLARDNAILQDEKLTADKFAESYERIFNELQITLEDEKSKTSVQRAKDDLQKLFGFVKKHSSITIINPETPKTPNPPTKPREKLGS